MAVPFSYEFSVGKLAKAQRREFAKQTREAKRSFATNAHNLRYDFGIAFVFDYRKHKIVRGEFVVL